MDDASTQGDGYCFGAVVNLKLGKNISYVHLYRVFRNRELAGDFFVSPSSRHQRQHLEFVRPPKSLITLNPKILS